jgi:hypothetical protein
LNIFRVGDDRLEAECELRFICLGFYSTVPHQFLARGVVFWILMGRLLSIRERESESSDIFMGRVDDFL